MSSVCRSLDCACFVNALAPNVLQARLTAWVPPVANIRMAEAFADDADREPSVV